MNNNKLFFYIALSAVINLFNFEKNVSTTLKIHMFSGLVLLKGVTNWKRLGNTG